MNSIEARRYLNQAFLDGKICENVPCKVLLKTNGVTCSDLLWKHGAIPCHLWIHSKLYYLLKGKSHG